MIPPHAYIPGQTPRHPEALFDPLKAGLGPGMSAADLAASAAWCAGLRYYHDGYFWECHEVLEAVWLAAPRGSQEHQLVQGVIQLANAGLKLRMGRPAAAARLAVLARGHGRAAGPDMHRLFDLPPDWIAAQAARLEEEARYAT